MKCLSGTSFLMWLGLGLAAVSGCNSTRFGSVLQHPQANSTDQHAASATESEIIQAALLPPVDAVTIRAVRAEQEPALDQELSLDALVAEVLTLNPNLGQMIAAWEAASARYPQVRSLDDPMLSGMIAPPSFGSNTVQPGYRVEVSQKFPFPGKLRLRGEGALAEASAAQNDVDDMRVQLIESAKVAFFDYFLVERAISVNEEGLRLLKEFKQSAESRYKTGLVPQQDVLQAQVEIGRQSEREVTLNRMRKVAIARINTLRNQDPTDALPPPPKKLDVVPGLPPLPNLLGYAQSQRPDLKALQDRIAVEQITLARSLKEYYPDLEFAAAYDTIMGNGPMRDLAPQAGIRLNVPLWQGKRRGAVLEANARIAQKTAELKSRSNQVSLQVTEAYEQLVESERIVGLYNKTILPAAEENVKAAQTAYVTGKTPFLSLVEAQRNLVNLRDRQYEATADYFRRRATLERMVGGPIDAAAEQLPVPRN